MFILPQKTNSFIEIQPAALIELANQDRRIGHEGILKVDPLLTKAAQMKADDMAARGYFSHTDPGGDAAWKLFTAVGYRYQYAGENLAINFINSNDINNAWMNSPLHRVNLLNNVFTDIGIGIAEGNYKGRETVFVVQFFGSRLG